MRADTRTDDIIARLKDIQQALARNSEDGKPLPIPLIDPTANVLSLVKAETKRQDDLRLAENTRQDDLRRQSEKYQEKLAVAESKRLDALAGQEARRIDALLAAATNNVALASQKADAQAATLAAQVASSAEALRNQVATTAAATAAQIGAMNEALGKRLTIVEQNQYVGAGDKLQRAEGRQINQWQVGIIIGVMLAAAQLISHFWK